MLGSSFWPPGLSGDVNVANFVRAYELVGYSRCQESSLVAGYEKIAIYTLNGDPTHAARQLPDGQWTSKCGGNFDIAHPSPDDVGGGVYGEVELYMRRPISTISA
jgi:hypothetical protein